MIFQKEFFPEFEKTQLEFGIRKSQKTCSMSASELMTLMIFVINDCGEIMVFKVTPGATNDLRTVDNRTQGLLGKLFGDKGYISKELFDLLFQRGLQLVTKIKKNMNNKLMLLFDKLLLRKKAIIETVNDQLKNISQIEHSRLRSLMNFMVNLISGLAAYALLPPCINIQGGRSRYADKSVLRIIFM